VSFIIRRYSFAILRMWWLFIAWLLLFIIILATTVSLLFPRIPQFRTEIETLVSQTLQQPVNIGKITTHWSNWTLAIELQQVELLDEQKKHHVIAFDHAAISVNLVDSWQQQKLITNKVILTGSELTVQRNADGSIKIVGMNKPEKSEDIQQTIDIKDFIHWLLQQPDIVLHAKTVTWIEPDKTQQQVQHLQLAIQPHENNHKITGQVDLPQGRLHINTLSQWQNADLQHLTGEFNLAPLSISHTKQTFQLQSIIQKPTSPLLPKKLATSTFLQGDIKLTQTAKKAWQLKVKKLRWHNFKLANIKIKFQFDRAHFYAQGHIPTLHLSALAKLYKKQLSSLKGQLNNINFHYKYGKWELNSHFKKLSYQDTSFPVKIKQLNGKLHLTDKKGQMTFKKGKINFIDKKLYSHPLTFKNVLGQVAWQRQSKSWLLSIKHLKATEQGLKVNVAGNITILDKGQPDLNLKVTLQQGKVNNIYRYLPDKEIPNTTHWMKKAFVSGKLDKVEAHLTGKPRTLLKNKKQFHFVGHVSNTILRYQQAWLPLKSLNAKITIQGRELTVESNQGKILQTQLQKVIAHIPNMGDKKPHLFVKGQLKGDAKNGLDFIAQTPLKDQFSEGALPDLAGNMQLALDLDIPLFNGKNVETKIIGKLNFNRVLIHAKRLDVKIADVIGKVSFDNHHLDAANLKGHLFDNPIQFGIQKSAESTKIHLKGMADKTFLQNLINNQHIDFSTFLSGQTQWQANINIQPNDTIDFRLNTDLRGMALNLPAPLQKTIEEKRQLNLHFHQKVTHTRLRFNYDRLFNGVWQTTSHHSTKGAILFGERYPVNLPEKKGWHLTGYLDTFSLTQWQSLLEQFQSSEEKTDFPLYVDVHIGQLALFKQHLKDIKLKLTHNDNNWKADIKGEGQLSGTIRFDAKKSKLNAVFKELIFQPLQHQKVATKKEKLNIDIQPQLLPTIAFHCDDLRIGNMTFGNVNLFTKPRKNSLEIETLEAKSKGLSLQIKGLWQGKPTPRTFLKASLTSNDIAELLQRLGFENAPIASHHAEFLLETEWQNHLPHFDLAEVEGRLKLLVNEGNIIDVDPGVGRVFSLFDLQTLPRRLMLDFNDVFHEGFTFNTLVGEFIIKNGLANTEHVILRSPSAQIEIQGQTDLINQIYDQTVIVIPHVSNTLPVAGALVGGLGVGAAALIVQKLLESEIEKTLRYHYRVTGNWNDPVIESVISQKREEN